MSRLIVKNLPKNVSEDKLREVFQEKGTITDIQLKYTSDGKFRQFAFIGYQDENEAQEAIKHFHHTFINTKKIAVEACATLGDSSKPKSWSKYAADSVTYKKLHPEKNEPRQEKKEQKKVDESEEILKKHQNDPMFEEFLELHAPEQVEKLRKVKQSEEMKEEEEDSGVEEPAKVADEKISDLEYMKKLVKKKEKTPRNFELYTIKLKGLPYNCTKKDIKAFLKPVTPFTIRRPVKIHGIAYAGFKSEKNFNKALLKDRSFLDGKRISVIKYTGQSEPDKQNNKKNTKWISQEEALKNEEDIAESGKIFFRNLAYTTTEEDIEELFKRFGPVAEINLPVDAFSKKMKGFGTVTFLMPEHAVKAYGELDGSVLHGRMLHLLPAKNKDVEDKESLDETTNFKKKKQAQQKSQAGSSHNWNALFLGHDAVAEAIADNYNTSKEKVLGDDSKGSAAVRLALGETQIVAETRKHLEREGVVLDVFSNVTKRSKTVIIVKNLPHKTEGKELRKIFEKYGLVGRVILPPSGITAMVEFLEPSEAKKAFTCLAYSKFKNVPLYLEWAPENSLVERDLKKQEEEIKEESEKEEEEAEEPEADTTIFVKNLNFQTTDQDLRKHFEGCGKLAYATVATKKDKTDPSKKLSMGYGFVRFIRKSSTDKALKTLQQSILDGKSLEMKRSERTLTNEVHVKKKVKNFKQTGTKILVRNIPFQANAKEIRELFSTFGEIKALRLPKKLALDGGSHRGFGFVDFVTASDAKNAFEALSQSTHLYGRRLVLEWATTEEGVEELRKRTASHYQEKEVKKSKKSVLTIDE